MTRSEKKRRIAHCQRRWFHRSSKKASRSARVSRHESASRVVWLCRSAARVGGRFATLPSSLPTWITPRATSRGVHPRMLEPVPAARRHARVRAVRSVAGTAPTNRTSSSCSRLMIAARLSSNEGALLAETGRCRHVPRAVDEQANELSPAAAIDTTREESRARARAAGSAGPPALCVANLVEPQPALRPRCAGGRLPRVGVRPEGVRAGSRFRAHVRASARRPTIHALHPTPVLPSMRTSSPSRAHCMRPGYAHHRGITELPCDDRGVRQQAAALVGSVPHDERVGPTKAHTPARSGCRP